MLFWQIALASLIPLLSSAPCCHSCVQCFVSSPGVFLHLPIPRVCRFPLSSNQATATCVQFCGGSWYCSNRYRGLLPEKFCVLGLNCIHRSFLTYKVKKPIALKIFNSISLLQSSCRHVEEGPPFVVNRMPFTKRFRQMSCLSGGKALTDYTIPCIPCVIVQ